MIAGTLRRCLTTASLLSLLASATVFNPVLAADLALTSLDGVPSNLQTFRTDGKWSLVLIRKQSCGDCDIAERELQQWYGQQDESALSVLAINLDAKDQSDAVVARLEDNTISYANYLADDVNQLLELYQSLTGNPMPEPPVWLLFGEEDHFKRSTAGIR